MDGAVWRPYIHGLKEALALRPTLLDLLMDEDIQISAGDAKLRFVLPTTMSAQVVPGGSAVVISRSDKEADMFIARVGFAGVAQSFWKVDLIILGDDEVQSTVESVCMSPSSHEVVDQIAALL